VWPGQGALTQMSRAIAGGRDRFLAYIVQATLDGNDVAQRWYAVWSRLNQSQQTVVPFDDVSAAAGIAPSEVASLVVVTGMKHAEDMTQIVKASLTPRIVRQMGKSALRIAGPHAEVAMRDRHLYLQGVGQLPVPRNASMTVNVNANASANAKAAAAAVTQPSVPTFLADMESLREPKEEVQRALLGEVAED
jgi:hypothetical protein